MPFVKFENPISRGDVWIRSELIAALHANGELTVITTHAGKFEVKGSVEKVRAEIIEAENTRKK